MPVFGDGAFKGISIHTHTHTHTPMHTLTGECDITLNGTCWLWLRGDEKRAECWADEQTLSSWTWQSLQPSPVPTRHRSRAQLSGLVLWSLEWRLVLPVWRWESWIWVEERVEGWGQDATERKGGVRSWVVKYWKELHGHHTSWERMYNLGTWVSSRLAHDPYQLVAF